MLQFALSRWEGELMIAWEGQMLVHLENQEDQVVGAKDTLREVDTQAMVLQS